MWKRRKENALLPQVGIITDIRRETPDVKTFRIVRPDGTKLFEHMPGQCAMLCVPGVGEALFSITSSPTNKEYQEFSIKECGTLTNYLHNMSVGDEILVRGPYGNHFPVETVLKDRICCSSPEVSDLLHCVLLLITYWTIVITTVP